MRILYVSSVDPSISDGPGVNEREFLTAVQRNPELRLHAILPSSAGPWPTDIDVRDVTFTFERHMTRPINAVRHQLSQGRAVRAHLARSGCDLVVVRPYPFPLGALLALYKGSVPYVLKNVGPKLVDIVDSRLPPAVRALGNINRIALQRLLEGAAMAETVSERQRRDVIRQFPHTTTQVYVIDNAVNTRRFFPQDREVAKDRTGLSRFRYIVGYAGNYPWVRGGKHIVDALQSLRDRFESIGAVILGGGDDQLVREHAKARGVADICTIPGRVPFETVSDYIASMDVGVSVLERKERGASEQKVRQYLASGRPVVTTPGSNDFVEEIRAGTVLRSDGQAAFNDAIAHWLSVSEHDWEEASINGRSYAVSELSVESALKKRLELWRHAMQLHGQRNA